MYLDGKYNKGCYISKCFAQSEVYETTSRHFKFLVLTRLFKMVSKMAAISKSINHWYITRARLYVCVIKKLK